MRSGFTINPPRVYFCRSFRVWDDIARADKMITLRVSGWPGTYVWALQGKHYSESYVAGSVPMTVSGEVWSFPASFLVVCKNFQSMLRTIPRVLPPTLRNINHSQLDRNSGTDSYRVVLRTRSALAAGCSGSKTECKLQLPHPLPVWSQAGEDASAASLFPRCFWANVLLRRGCCGGPARVWARRGPPKRPSRRSRPSASLVWQARAASHAAGVLPGGGLCPAWLRAHGVCSVSADGKQLRARAFLS